MTALDERLVVLVARAIGDRDCKGDQKRPTAQAGDPQDPPPEEAEQPIFGRVHDLASDEVDRSEAGGEIGLGGQSEDHRHQHERRRPWIEPSGEGHGHNLDSIAALLAITTKSPYAVRALTELARSGGSGPVSIGEIARRRDIPVQFLESLFGTLRRAGVLHSQRGVKGGYSFARPPGEITVLEVVELLEGELDAEASDAGSIWVNAVEAARAVLGAATIAGLAEDEARATGAAMYHI